MFQTSIASSIIQVIRQLHKPENYCKQPQRGLLFELDLRINDYANSEEHECGESCDVYIIVAGNRSVWIHIKDEPTYKSAFTLPREAWENTCNHDCCWSTDGIERPLTQLYFEMCERVNPRVAPITLSQFTTFKWSDIVLTWEKDPSDKWKYKRRLTGLKAV